MLRFLPILLLAFACTAEAPAPSSSTTASPAANWAAPEAVSVRVAEAEARLQQTEAGQRVWASIEAHGGLVGWFSNGPLAYRFDYRRMNGSGIDTYQEIDVWSSRAVHRMAADSSVSLGWTGTEAWQHPADADIGTNARFWALTPYYFVGVPFVFADPGVNHSPAQQLVLDGVTYDQVYITFGENVGDAPDDYYYLILDPQTNRVAGVRYTVTYPGFFDPGQRSAERLLLYDGEQSTAGLIFPTDYRSFLMTEDGPGDQATNIRLTDLSFRPDLPRTHFDLPAAAAVQDAL